MSDRLTELGKQPGVHTFGVRRTWRGLSANIALKITGSEATMACQYEQMRDILKAGIYCMVHEIQAIWDKHLTTEDW